MSAEKANSPRVAAEERRAQIVEIATQLFARHGLGGVTMATLAKECGVTEPALYRYFRSKDQLYEAVLISLKSRLDIDAALAKFSQIDNVKELLFGIATYIVKTYGASTELSRLLLLSALEGHPLAKRAFDDLRTPYVTLLTRKLSAFKREGRIRDVHPEITARCFIGMVMDCSLSFHLWRELHGKTFKPEDVINNNVPIYVQGLRLDLNSK